MSEHKEPIPSMIYNAAVGGHVTNSQQIIDENENKEQSQINAEVKQILGQGDSVDTRIANAVNTEKIRAEKAEQLLQEQYNALTQSDVVVGTLPESGTKNLIYRVPGTSSYFDYMWNGTQFIKMAEYNNAIDDEPTAGSNNLVKSGGINKKFTTLDIENESKAQLLHTYILNVFVIPKTAEFINAASISSMNVSLWSIRNSSLGGENSIISLRLWMGDTYADYYTEIVPDIKTNGNIIKLEKVIPYGVFVNGADVWIELNETADFNTPTELIPGGFDIKVSLLNNQQQALFNFINKTSTTFIADVPSLSPLQLFKDTVIDYRTLRKIASFDGNLFDKNHIINGYYMLKGVYYAVENYSAAYLPVPLEKGQTYSCNYASVVHFDILKEQDLTSVIHISHGTTDWSITESDGIITFTVPSNLDYNVCAVVSILSDEVDNIVFNKGTQIKDKRFLVRIGENENHHIIVDKQGMGDYTTLTEATNNATDGSIIIVYPGVYDNECITAGTSKTLFIIGIDRDKCIIKNNLGDYQYSVIHISSGLLRNLTIIQEATSTNDNGAYGVHADFNTGENSSLRIENCHLQSNVPNTGAIGIGLRQNMNLTIKGCRLVSGTSGRALYAHDGGERLSQYLHVIDSIIESPNQAILIQGQATAELDFTKEQFYIEFIRNRIVGTCQFINWNTNHGTVTQDDFQGVRNLRLVATSWGNSASVLNAE